MSTQVLLVDDDPAVRKAVGKALGQAGFAVTAVDNGLAALEAIQGHAYGVVVSDIRMDLMDGLRFYRELEAEFPELQDRVVFVSAWADDRNISDFLAKTGRPLIKKPFDLRDLLDLVKETAIRTAPPSQTFLPFSPQEAARLRGLAIRPGATLACPRCGGDLAIKSRSSTDGGAGWELRCHACYRSLAITPAPVAGDPGLNPSRSR